MINNALKVYIFHKKLLIVEICNVNKELSLLSEMIILFLVRKVIVFLVILVIEQRLFWWFMDATVLFLLFMQSFPENQTNRPVEVFWINSTLTLFTFIYSCTNGWFPQTRFFSRFSVDIVDCWERVFLCGFTCVGHS